MRALLQNLNLAMRRVSYSKIRVDDEDNKLAIGNFVTLRSSTKDFLPSASEFLDGDDKCVVPWHFLEGE